MPVDYVKRPPPPSTGRARHRGRLLALMVVVVVAGIVVAVGWARPAWIDPVLPDRLRSAQGVSLPASAANSALGTYLRGKGKPLEAYANAVPPSLTVSVKDRCAALTARLTAAGSPPSLAKLAVAAPDPAFRDAAVTSLDRVELFLGQCQRGRVDAQVRKDAEFTTTVLRRLIERSVTG